MNNSTIIPPCDCGGGGDDWWWLNEVKVEFKDLIKSVPRLQVGQIELSSGVKTTLGILIPEIIMNAAAELQKTPPVVVVIREFPAAKET